MGVLWFLFIYLPEFPEGGEFSDAKLFHLVRYIYSRYNFGILFPPRASDGKIEGTMLQITKRDGTYEYGIMQKMSTIEGSHWYLVYQKGPPINLFWSEYIEKAASLLLLNWSGADARDDLASSLRLHIYKRNSKYAPSSLSKLHIHRHNYPI